MGKLRRSTQALILIWSLGRATFGVGLPHEGRSTADESRIRQLGLERSAACQMSSRYSTPITFRIGHKSSRRSLLERDSFAVSLLNFPVLLFREFRGKSLESRRKCATLFVSRAELRQTSLYFPAKQGNAKQRRVRR